MFWLKTTEKRDADIMYLKVVSGLSSFLRSTGCDDINRQMWVAERESWICNQEARVQILLGHIFYVISHSYHYGSCVSSYARLTQKYIIFHKIYGTPSKTRPVKCPCSKSSTKVWDHWVQSEFLRDRIFQANQLSWKFTLWATPSWSRSAKSLTSMPQNCQDHQKQRKSDKQSYSRRA